MNSIGARPARVEGVGTEIAPDRLVQADVCTSSASAVRGAAVASSAVPGVAASHHANRDLARLAMRLSQRSGAYDAKSRRGSPGRKLASPHILAFDAIAHGVLWGASAVQSVLKGEGAIASSRVPVCIVNSIF
jgi:hypothetical protein